MITEATLRAIAPGATYAPEMAAALNRWGPQFGCDTPLRLAHFLAQTAQESGGFARLRENLSYSAERLVAVWPSRFPTVAAAAPFARNPRALAAKVYDGRLGNDRPGDGWTFRGWGPGQITGRGNTTRVAELTGFALLTTPSLMDDPGVGTACALALWEDRGCNALADSDDVAAVTRRWQGGQLALAERTAWLAKAKAALAAAPDAPPLPARKPDAPAQSPLPSRATPAADPWWVRALSLILSLFGRKST